MEEREMKRSAMCRRRVNRRKEMRRVGGLKGAEDRVRWKRSRKTGMRENEEREELD